MACNRAGCRAGIEGFPSIDFSAYGRDELRQADINPFTIMTITEHKTMAVFTRYNRFWIND
jgi:hypothetical protein